MALKGSQLHNVVIRSRTWPSITFPSLCHPCHLPIALTLSFQWHRYFAYLVEPIFYVVSPGVESPVDAAQLRWARQQLKAPAD